MHSSALGSHGVTGSPSAKSNAWIKEVVDNGGWKSLFSQLVLNENHSELRFKFASPVGTAALRCNADKVFAMVDSEEIRTIGSAASEALFYTKAAMVAKADQPGKARKLGRGLLGRSALACRAR